MPSDLTKRDRLLRTYWPECFEEEAPAVHGKVVEADGVEIDAVTLGFR